MRHLIVVVFILVSTLSFSQEKNKDLKQLPLLILVGNNGNFNSVYNKLDALSKNITETTVVLKREDEIRQGLLIISTENLGKSFNAIHLDTRPSLNIEVQRVMFTGNFHNPRSPGFIKVN